MYDYYYKCLECGKVLYDVQEVYDHKQYHETMEILTWVIIGAIVLTIVVMLALAYSKSGSSTSATAPVKPAKTPKNICGFTFEDDYFTTPSRSIIPYSYEFMTLLNDDGTITINMISIGKVETFPVSDPDSVLKQIAWRKGGCKGPAPDHGCCGNQTPEPPGCEEKVAPKKEEFKDCTIGGVKFMREGFVLPDGDGMLYAEIAGVKNIRNKYVVLVFGDNRKDRKFWTGEDTDTVLEEFVRRCGFVEL